MIHERSRTLASQLGATTAARDAVVIVGASLFLAVLSQVEIRLPWTPVPVTLQTFGVFLVGAALGARRGAVAVAAYVAQGAAGLPYFSGGAGGPAHLLGPTGGYLLGFIVAAYVIGWLAERGWDRNALRTFAAMTLGSLIIFAFGAAQLSFFVPAHRILATGVTPFLLGALLKVALASLLLPAVWSVLPHEKRNHEKRDAS